jgi:uncharacterized protein YkwD
MQPRTYLSIAVTTVAVILTILGVSASTPAAARDVVREILDLTNKERQAEGIAPLTPNWNLTNAAQRHSRDMADHGVLNHVGTDGSRMGDRIGEAGYEWSAIAENIASGTSSPERAVALWMHSPGHRKNMLNPRYHELGVGYAFNGRTHYWTQDFGSRR